MPDINRDEFQTLLSHMEWADACLWAAVLGLPAAREDRRTRELLYHLHSVQHAYLHVWRRQPFAIPALDELADLTAVRDWARPCYRDARALLARLTRQDLSSELRMPWAEAVSRRFGSAGASTLAETVLQVVLHTTHHRGQAATRFRELGGDPPTTDFIAWIWQNRPEPAW